jgi:DivIVA domain-containing protein
MEFSAYSGPMSGGDALDRGENGGQSSGSSATGGLMKGHTVTNTIDDVVFPVSMRGYDREAVDSYVSRVREVVAGLEASRSPEAAVKEALEKVGEQTRSVLASAGQSAEQITVAARREAEESGARAKSAADEMVAKAKAEASEIVARSQAEAKETVAKARKEAAEHLQRSQEEVTALREEAEARLRELHSDTESIQQERSQLLNEIREFATRVEEVASAADARFPQREAAGTDDDETRDSKAADQTDAPDVTADTRQNAPS